MESTKQILVRLPLHENDANLLGERLANDVVLREFIGTLHQPVDRSVVRLWIMTRIRNPENFIRSELDKQLGVEWATEPQKDTIVKDEHLLTSFSQRLQIIRKGIRVYWSLEDALSSPK